MLKKTIISLLITVLILSSVSSFKHVSYAASNPSCSSIIKGLENTASFIKHLFDSYEKSMRYANDPFHAKYRVDHLGNAKSSLEMISNQLDGMNYYMSQLASCRGYNDEETDRLVKALGIYFNLMTRDSFQSLEKEQVIKYNRKYGESYLALSQLKEHPVYKPLYDTFWENPSSENQRVLGLFIKNVVEGVNDKTLYRFPSLETEASNANNATVVADGVYSFINQLINKDVDLNKRGDLSFLTSSAISKLKNIVKGNVTSMTARGFYKTLFQESVTRKYMSPEQQELGDMIAGDLASVMSSTDPISMGLAYGELVHDINDYNIKHIKAVNDGMDKITLSNQNLRLISATTEFSSKVSRKLYSNSVTAIEYTKFLQDELKELEKEFYAIYQLDPNKIKIYYKGKVLETSASPFVENGTTMVPLRLIVEQLGLDIKWNAKNQTITFKTDRSMIFRNRTIDITLTVGSKTANIGSWGLSLAEAPVVIEGTTYVPLRFISQQVGIDVSWVPESQSILLN